MSFSENIAKVVADQLARFVTLNRHQLAGHVANLDFWVAQVRHALDVIDGYSERFRKLKVGQAEQVARYQTTTFQLNDTHIKGTPSPPKRVADSALREARRSVTEATYQFLIRCCKDGLIPESQLRATCESLGISVDAADLGQR
jgi:hypothetical protein